MDKHSLVRTIYIYLFALVGLSLLTVGVVKLVDLGLKMYVFPKAEQEMYKSSPPLLKIGGPMNEITSEDVKGIAEACKENSEISEDQKQLLTGWLGDYKEWKERQFGSGELRSIKRQKTASWAFALIIIGLPLYLFHWRIIRKETKNKEE